MVYGLGSSVWNRVFVGFRFNEASGFRVILGTLAVSGCMDRGRG